MSRCKIMKFALMLVVFSLLLGGGVIQASAGDVLSYQKIDELTTQVISSNQDVDYDVYATDNDVCLIKLPADDTDSDDDDTGYTAPYIEWGSSGPFTISNIGDSYQANTDIQTTYTSRLTDPDYEYRSIPNYTTPTFHDFSGQRLGGILSGVQSQNLGAQEGVDFVLIQGGTNDINLDRSVDLDTLVNRMIYDIQRIIDEVLNGVSDPNERPAIIVSAIPPMLDGSLTDKSEALMERLITSLDKVDIITTANFWDLYNADTDTANGDYMKDNIHTNADGSYMVAENWFEAVDALYNPYRIANDPYIYAGNWYFDRSGTVASLDELL